MKSDEMVTGSVSRVPREAEQTPDTEVKEMGGGKPDSQPPGSAKEDSAVEGEGAAEASRVSESSQGDDEVPRKPNLSKEQQDWLNKVFIPNFRKELMRQVQFDRKLLEQHRRELERRKREEESRKEALQAASEENEKLVGTISELKVDRALVSAAAANNAINPDQVRKLLKERVKLGEDLEPIVLDEKGERQLNQNGEFMMVEEQVRSFLSENPHLVKPGPTRSGGGSLGSSSAGQGFAGGPSTGGDLIAEGLVEESRNHPTRTLSDFNER